MPAYPNTIPTLPTLVDHVDMVPSSIRITREGDVRITREGDIRITREIPEVPGDYPQAQHWNVPNREIEAICMELGINPRSIQDTILPRRTPVSVAAYLDMLAYIVKTITGASAWYNAAVPSRCLVGGHGNLATIAAGAQSALIAFSRGVEPVANINRTLFYVPYACTLNRMGVQIETAQPGTGTLVFTIMRNGVTVGTITIPAGHGAGGTGDTGAGLGIAFAAGSYFTCSAQNNAATASAQIGSWSTEFDLTPGL